MRRVGASFKVVDVGYDLEQERETLVDSLATTDPSAWRRDLLDELYPAVAVSTGGVEQRLSFGSDFPRDAPT